MTKCGYSIGQYYAVAKILKILLVDGILVIITSKISE
jgi:hypothetical protein